MDSIKSAPDTVIKTSITLAYVGLCLYLIISMAGEGKCFVRHAYTSAPADSFHANPLYQSTNLVMKPPPSKYLPMPSWISKEHPTQPPLLQVAAFPVVHENRTRDSAFLQMSKSTSYMVNPNPTGWTAPTGDAALLFGSLQLVSQQQVPTGTTGSIFTHLANLISAGASSGAVPNLGRCLHGNATESIMDFVASYQRIGMCALTGLQQEVQVSYSQLTSINLFSTVNVPYMLLLSIWLSASFTLIVINTWNEVCFLIAAAGNLSFIIVSLIPTFTTQNVKVPMNNAVLGIVACSAAQVVQYLWYNTEDEDSAKVSSTIKRLNQKTRYVAASSKKFEYFDMQSPFIMAATGVDNIKERKLMHYVSITETIITTPILTTCILAAVSSTIPVWALQVEFVTLMMSQFLFVPWRKLQAWNGDVSLVIVKNLISLCMTLLAIASTSFYLASSWVFWTYAGEVATGKFFGSTLSATVVILYVLNTIYFLGVWMSPRIKSKFMDIDDIPNLILRFLNVLCVVVVGSMASSQAINMSFPAYRCSPWSKF